MMQHRSNDAGMGAGPGSEIRLTNESAIYVGVALRCGSRTHLQMVPGRFSRIRSWFQCAADVYAPNQTQVRLTDKFD